MKSFSNSITSYDEMIYNSRPVKFDEFVSDKYNKVHVELFNDALDKYYNDMIDSKIDSKFIFELFKLLETVTYNDDKKEYYENFYNKISSSNNYVKKIINELSINANDTYKYLFDTANEYIDNIKSIIIDNDVLLDSVNNIIKNLSYIGDFRIIYLNNAIFLEAENDDEIFEHEFESYSYEVDNNDIEIISENVFMTEKEDYVFILENENGIKLVYNKNGEFTLILDDAKYNPNIDFNIFNYIDSKNKSLLALFKDYILTLYKDEHRIIEIKNDEYWQPSSIIVISTVSPYTKKIESLDKYWNNTQSKSDLNISDIKLTDYDINDAEILEINYVSGKARLRSKLNDMEFEVPFEYLNDNIDVSNDLIVDFIK